MMHFFFANVDARDARFMVTLFWMDGSDFWNDVDTMNGLEAASA